MSPEWSHIFLHCGGHSCYISGQRLQHSSSDYELLTPKHMTLTIASRWKHLAFNTGLLALNMQTHHSPTPGREQEPAAEPSSFC